MPTTLSASHTILFITDWLAPATAAKSNSTKPNEMVSLNIFPNMCAQYVAGNLVKLWCYDTGGSIPRTVIFGDKGQRVKVYCLENGEW